MAFPTAVTPIVGNSVSCPLPRPGRTTQLWASLTAALNRRRLCDTFGRGGRLSLSSCTASWTFCLQGIARLAECRRVFAKRPRAFAKSQPMVRMP